MGGSILIDIITADIIQSVGVTVAEYAFGKAGDKLLDTFVGKHKISKILKDDRKFIKKQFEGIHLESINFHEEDIVSFFFKNIFQDLIFLYPVSIIPQDQSQLLLERFFDYFTIKDNNKRSSTEVVRLKLDACINHHNELINKYILTESERIILKTIHRNQSDLLGYMGKTLDSSSELLFKNYNLDYSHKQIEAILHALRMDMRHYRLSLMFYSLALTIMACIAIIMVPSIVKIGPHLNIGDGDLITVFLIPATTAFVISWVLLMLRLSAKKKLDKYEERISAYMDALWELHFESYRRKFSSISETLFSTSGEDSHIE